MINIRAKLESLQENVDKEIEALYQKHASECAMLNKSMIRDGINTSTDIHGKRFEPILGAPTWITTKSRKRRGNPEQPPLKETGNLYSGVVKRKNFIFNTVDYGDLHNEGFTHRSGTRVAQREYFGTPDGFFESPEYKMLVKKLDMELENLFKKRKRKKRI